MLRSPYGGNFSRFFGLIIVMLGLQKKACGNIHGQGHGRRGGGDPRPGGWGEKFPPRGPAPGEGGGRKFFFPGGSSLVKIGQNFFTWGVIW